jgi:hypothetical protein
MPGSDEIYESLVRVEAQQQILADNMHRVVTDLNRVTTILITGNGKLPLTAQIVELQSQCAECKEDKSKDKEAAKDLHRVKWETWSAIVVALISAVAALVIGLSAGDSDIEQQILQRLDHPTPAQVASP